MDRLRAIAVQRNVSLALVIREALERKPPRSARCPEAWAWVTLAILTSHAEQPRKDSLLNRGVSV